MNIVEEYGPKQMEDFEKMRVLPAHMPPPSKGESLEQSANQSPFQWLDDMLFGWSTSKTDSRESNETSQTVSRGENSNSNSDNKNVNLLKEGDFDAVVSFVSFLKGFDYY